MGYSAAARVGTAVVSNRPQGVGLGASKIAS